jgi:uncharacterized membrane protein
MTLRGPTERIVQAMVFEATGLALMVPLYAALFGRPAGESMATLAMLTLIALVWSPLHNSAYDRVEFRLTGRTACCRPAVWRAVHALSHEGTVLALTIPAMLAVSDHTALEILAVSAGLTLFYAAWTALFHVVWDRLRPVGGGLAVSRRPDQDDPRAPCLSRRSSAPAPSGS